MGIIYTKAELRLHVKGTTEGGQLSGRALLWSMLSSGF